MKNYNFPAKLKTANYEKQEPGVIFYLNIDNVLDI